MLFVKWPINGKTERWSRTLLVIYISGLLLLLLIIPPFGIHRADSMRIQRTDITSNNLPSKILPKISFDVDWDERIQTSINLGRLRDRVGVPQVFPACSCISVHHNSGGMYDIQIFQVTMGKSRREIHWQTGDCNYILPIETVKLRHCELSVAHSRSIDESPIFEVRCDYLNSANVTPIEIAAVTVHGDVISRVEQLRFTDEVLPTNGEANSLQYCRRTSTLRGSLNRSLPVGEHEALIQIRMQSEEGQSLFPEFIARATVILAGGVTLSPHSVEWGYVTRDSQSIRSLVTIKSEHSGFSILNVTTDHDPDWVSLTWERISSRVSTVLMERMPTQLWSAGTYAVNVLVTIQLENEGERTVRIPVRWFQAAR